MVGLNVKEPETKCDDPNCPFHGIEDKSLKVLLLLIKQKGLLL